MSEDPDHAEREKSFRGISVRLAVNYLENLGGEVVTTERGHETRDDGGDDDFEALVVGDGWRAMLSAATVEIGPSIELTEVTVAFEGEADGLDGLVERFSQKAMRAGG